MAEHLAGHGGPDGEIVRAAAHPISPTGGLVVLRGNLAPNGALIKIAGLETLLFEGRARVFDGEEACFAAVQVRQYAQGTC
jgi:dihydroxy-acid dehydratase